MELCSCGVNEAIWDSKSRFYILCKECQQKERLLTVIAKKEEAGIPSAYLKYTFADFNESKVDRLTKLTDNFKKNVVLTGKSYIGKTAFASAIASYILSIASREISVKFLLVPQLMVSKEDLFSYYSCDLLILDDFIEFKTDELYWSIYNLLAHRANEGLITLTTTNLEDISDSRLKSRLLREGGVWLNVDKSCRN